jgi:methylenetetrahydrofolate dehydrogenase (NADP+)/methenyltetrahydrofolate cyclohydrolase
MTQLIDGKAFAASLREKIGAATQQLRAQHNITPGLAVVLVGDDPASHVYVRNKKKMTEAAGMHSYEHVLPADTRQKDLLALVAKLNADAAVHGILVQLPLPKHIDENAIINAIDPAKDVDGFHVVNTGLLATGQADAFVSCTPLGCLMLIQDQLGDDLSGKHAVVIGRSNIVGKPMAQLLLNHNATVTICHSRTHNIEALCAQADILVAAVGRAEIVKASWVKDGAVVIDVGINRNDEGKLIGDVAYAEVSAKAAAITPVPGGVGPMTIACLLRNTLQSACRANGVVFSL